MITLLPRNYIILTQALLSAIMLVLTGFSILPSTSTSTPEVCNNALDDDLDGLVDLNDPDCVCDTLAAVSLIPNPSFESLDCCPLERSQLRCATGWDQASLPTTDLIHTCGFMGWDSFPPPQPFPDGQGVMGFRDGRVRGANNSEPNWKEYAGACLLNPMRAYTTYRFEFYLGFVDQDKSPPINITFFGATDCGNLPFGLNDQLFGCPTNGPGWVELGDTRVSNDRINPWVLASIEVTPDTDIEAIVIGAPCAATQSPASTYYFFDNLVLADVRYFDFKISPVSSPCSEAFKLAVPDIPSFTYQWYRDGVALIGETSYELSKIYGDGFYQIKVEDANGCRIPQGFDYRKPVFQTTTSLTICPNETYTFGSQSLSQSGIYIDTIRSANSCDSIVTLELIIQEEQVDTIRGLLLSGEEYTIGSYTYDEAGAYLVQFASTQGCDSLVFLQLEVIEIFFPNVFSPNEDGVNDRFQLFTQPGIVEHVELRIFDRWGTLVHKGADWDGRYADEEVPDGVYVYVARVWFADGRERQFGGDVTVVR